jgi:putative FmdB family regulatory protein
VSTAFLSLFLVKFYIIKYEQEGATMPIYEYYCQNCHVIFDFFSRKINTTIVPSCPQCKREKLKKYVSLFSTISGEKKEQDPEHLPVDEAKMDKALKMLDREAENINAEDPKEATQVIRKLTEMMGIKIGAGMKEAFDRLEAGDDPEEVEAQMGDTLEEELLSATQLAQKVEARRNIPHHNDTLYELEKYVLSESEDS